jgi:hypothetical protein
MGDSYDQKDAAGFIRILGLPSRSRAIKTQAKRSTMEAPKTLQGKEEVAQ